MQVLHMHAHANSMTELALTALKALLVGSQARPPLVTMETAFHCRVVGLLYLRGPGTSAVLNHSETQQM